MTAAGFVAVIADDLTGASDAGVQFAHRGLQTLVVLDRLQTLPPDRAQAIAVDTDTRGVPPDVAYARVREVAKQLRELRPDLVYKKIDSTLRGNVAVEIEAVMAAFGFELAIVAPAYPAQGRTTRDGIHYLRGVPVHQAEPGHDSRAPVRDADLMRMLGTASRRRVSLIGLDMIRGGPHAIQTSVADGASLLVCDAETDADLRHIVRGLADRRHVLWVGSAGLAEHLVELPRVSRRVSIEAEGPILVVSGSLSEVTRRQISALAEHACIYGVDQSADLHAVLGVGWDAVLVGRSEPVAKLAAECVRAGHVGGLVLTGGETARAACRELGVATIQLLGEVEPGVPLGVLVGSTASRLPVVTKAGAFGSDTTLLRALQTLKGGKIT